ncbi:hypothetical protein ACU8V7_21450 [Zobellia nedashkovskayae]
MECLEQLLKVIVISELCYVEGAINKKAPLMRIFMEQCAIERSNFILNVWHVALKQNQKTTLSDLYNWHNQLYGKDYLHMQIGLNLNIDVLDRKALEICRFMLQMNLPDELTAILTEQSIKIETSLLALVQIRSLSEN